MVQSDKNNQESREEVFDLLGAGSKLTINSSGSLLDGSTPEWSGQMISLAVVVEIPIRDDRNTNGECAGNVNALGSNDNARNTRTPRLNLGLAILGTMAILPMYPSV